MGCCGSKESSESLDTDTRTDNNIVEPSEKDSSDSDNIETIEKGSSAGKRTFWCLTCVFVSLFLLAGAEQISYAFRKNDFYRRAEIYMNLQTVTPNLRALAPNSLAPNISVSNISIPNSALSAPAKQRPLAAKLNPRTKIWMI
eukprot:342258_1